MRCGVTVPRHKRPDQDEIARKGLALRRAGVSDRAAAEQLKVNPATLRLWIRQLPPDEPPPPLVVSPAPPSAPGLPARLRELAAELASVGLPDRAATALEAAVALEAAPVPELEPPEAEIAEGDTVAALRRLYRELQTTAAKARSVGNMSVAQRALRDAGALFNTIVRAEKMAAAADGSIHFTRAEIEDAKAAFRARVDALLAQPLTCAACGAELRALWASEDA